MKIGFIGAGNMATAIIGGLVRADYNKKDIIVYDVFEEKLKEFGEMGLTVSDSSVSLAKDADIIVLAVKPQQYGEVLEGIAGAATTDKTFVSIAAGITVEYVRRKLMINAPVVRVMPNTPLLLGKGAKLTLGNPYSVKVNLLSVISFEMWSIASFSGSFFASSSTRSKAKTLHPLYLPSW